MIRLLIAFCCVLGLVVAPVGKSHAASHMSMSSCDFGTAAGVTGMTDMPTKPAKKADHLEMHCCTSLCHAPLPVAIQTSHRR